MQVIVKVLPDAARALHQRGPPTTGSQEPQEPQEPLRIVEALSVTLEPMHPGTKDSNLMSYFIVDVSDFETAQRVIDRLQKSIMIEAAYIKPPDELP